jgi:hypothetical protein
LLRQTACPFAQPMLVDRVAIGERSFDRLLQACVAVSQGLIHRSWGRVATFQANERNVARSA